MSTEGPSSSPAKRAWEVCRFTRRLHLLDIDLVLLGLRHAVEIGAAGVAAVTPDARNADALWAARLFAALQLKLRREQIAAPSCERLVLLLPLLPAHWQSILRGHLAQATGLRRADAVGGGHESDGDPGRGVRPLPHSTALH